MQAAARFHVLLAVNLSIVALNRAKFRERLNESIQWICVFVAKGQYRPDQVRLLCLVTR